MVFAEITAVLGASTILCISFRKAVSSQQPRILQDVVYPLASYSLGRTLVEWTTHFVVTMTLGRCNIGFFVMKYCENSIDEYEI